MPEKIYAFLRVRCLAMAELGSGPTPPHGEYSVPFPPPSLLHTHLHHVVSRTLHLFPPEVTGTLISSLMDFFSSNLFPQSRFSCILLCLYFVDNFVYCQFFSFLLPSLFYLSSTFWLNCYQLLRN